MDLLYFLRSTVKVLTRLLIYFTILFFIGLTLYVDKYFDKVTIDQAISTINFGIDGALTGDSIFIKRFVKWCFLIPLFTSIALIVVHKLQKSYIKKTSNRMIIPLIKTSKALIHPLLLSIVAAGLFFNQFQVMPYLKYFVFNKNNQNDYFKSHYRDPKTVDLEIKDPKNLILIYVESYEASYANQELFGRNLLKPLEQWESKGYSFSEYKQMSGTGWTIAGIVGTQCGMPLKQLTIFNGNRLGENINHFLPNATCLTDILAKYHFYNIFLSGATSYIGGKSIFLRDHHYHEIYDKDKWKQLGYQESQMTAWGLSDHDIFHQAKKILAKQMSTKQPFNLTILTADTHGDKGQMSEYCHNKGYQNFTGIVACTAESISDFLNYIKEKNWEDKLNIVIIGDHLVMKNTLSYLLDTVTTRSMYNLFLTKQHFYKTTDRITSYNLLPTILQLAGFKFDGKIGLGYSALSHEKNKKIAENELSDEKINLYSDAYKRFWLPKTVS